MANIDIYYKDWGKGQPIVFSPWLALSADDWDTQMLFFSNTATASSPMTDEATAVHPDERWHDMDHYADDLAALTAAS